jgi:large subunit ribosomal protein L4
LYDILNADKIVLTPSAVDYLNGRYGENYQDDDGDYDEEEEDEDDNVEEEVVENVEEGK